jgi:hypothetical protein
LVIDGRGSLAGQVGLYYRQLIQHTL